MKVCRTIAEYRAEIAGFRALGESVGLVTTMGALHAGHRALVEAARAAHDRVVTTIFVNPTQFGQKADLENYPRTEEADLAMFREAGVDAVLIPTVTEIYPEGDETIVETTRLANVFHGQIRPGHFRGVATVVTKLFNIATPDAAYFGEKDYQQLAVIRRMVRDLHMPLAIVGVPTVREPDGLAMSSRNVRLMPEDRAAAPILSASLDVAEGVARQGATVTDLEEVVRSVIATEPRATLKGLDIVWADTFEPAEGPVTRTVGIMISADFGEVLLIDQREITP
ncbi:MAG: pantoate--beta-alanine ligase [Silicimonas sp.]